jgi:hypothetical protein
MSDKDIAFLRNTAASLNTDMSEKQFKKELANLKSKYQEILNKSTVDTTQDNQINTEIIKLTPWRIKK